MVRSMLKARWVDDGMYCIGFWIEEEDGTRFAETSTQEAAAEIVRSVNAIRGVAARIAEVVNEP